MGAERMAQAATKTLTLGDRGQDGTGGFWLKECDPTAPLRAAGPGGWIPATAPGTVQQDLRRAGLLPDPFVGDNERAVAWVGERDWLYRCQVELPEGFAASGQALRLRLAGLDTCATIYWDGVKLAESDNMFVPVEVALPAGTSGGTLHLHFAAAPRVAKAREAAARPMRVWNGDPSRVYLRKAQYHFGWDWGPVLLCAGPYRPIEVLAFSARVLDVHAPAVLADDLRQAQIPVHLRLELAAAPPPGLRLHLLLLDPAGAPLGEAAPALWWSGPQQVSAAHDFTVCDPALWWPSGQGAQPRYTVVTTVLDGDQVLDQHVQHLGLRRVRLVQEPLRDEPGASFHFEVNGRALFLGGANWIPADSFLPAVSANRYRALLEAAREANLLMLRVWGGGIYEEDVFYDLCDELGLLVWQDFMFACGLYPADAAFQASVRREAEAAVRRLRHHPSLVLWCGNNEDYALATSLGVHGPGLLTEAGAGGDAPPPFVARTLYEELLAAVCAAEDPTRPYWPGSPYTGAVAEQDPNGGLVGDRHTWEVWHGQMADYQDYGRFAGRFVSEFGMQAYPALSTVAAMLPPGAPVAAQDPAGEVLRWHNKADGGMRRLSSYVVRNFCRGGTALAHELDIQDDPAPAPLPADLPGRIYLTQLMQAEALGAAYRSFRRRFGGPGQRAVSGALVWQWDDCWPCISWAVIDHELVRKPSFFAIRRELSPLGVGLAHDPDGPALWASNGTAAAVDAEVELLACDFDGATVYHERRAVHLPPDQSTALPPPPPLPPEAVLLARLRLQGQVVARATLFPQPLGELPLRDPGLVVTVAPGQVLLRVARPAKGVLLSAPGARFADNLLDLLPGDDQVIAVVGLSPQALHVRWLGGPGEVAAGPEAAAPEAAGPEAAAPEPAAPPPAAPPPPVTA